MIPQIIYKSDKQIISKFECAGDVSELEVPAHCITSAIFSSPGIPVEDLLANKVINPYSSVRLAAGVFPCVYGTISKTISLSKQFSR
ncbi:MAG: hypothetical protein LLF94_04420 [Chlamydiales bacterium]|nr:hypothetical protein [Chlamydiales bacterium]